MKKNCFKEKYPSSLPLCPGCLVPFAQLSLSSLWGPAQAPPDLHCPPHPRGCAWAPGHLLLSDTSEQEGNSTLPSGPNALGNRICCILSVISVLGQRPVPPPPCIQVVDGSLHYAPSRVVSMGHLGPREGTERLWALEASVAEPRAPPRWGQQAAAAWFSRTAPALHLLGAAAGKIFQIS